MTYLHIMYDLERLIRALHIRGKLKQTKNDVCEFSVFSVQTFSNASKISFDTQISSANSLKVNYVPLLFASLNLRI